MSHIEYVKSLGEKYGTFSAALRKIIEDHIKLYGKHGK